MIIQNQCVMPRTAFVSLERIANHQVAAAVINLKAKSVQMNGHGLVRSSAEGRGLVATGLATGARRQSINGLLSHRRPLPCPGDYECATVVDGREPGLRSRRSSSFAQRRKMTVTQPR